MNSCWQLTHLLHLLLVFVLILILFLILHFIDGDIVSCCHFKWILFCVITFRWFFFSLRSLASHSWHHTHICLETSAILVNPAYIVSRNVGLWAFVQKKSQVKPFRHSVLLYLYALSVLLLIYSSLNFTELESVADIEYGSIDHSPGCILSADWALRQMPSLWSYLHLERENNYCLSEIGKPCGLCICTKLANQKYRV